MYVTGLPLKVDVITVGQEFVKAGDTVKAVQATGKSDAKPTRRATEGAAVMRDFIERVLRIPRAVLTIMVILLIGGGFAYATLPKESFPAIDIPYFYVATSDTGVSPQDVDRLITKPIEDKLKDPRQPRQHHVDLDARLLGDHARVQCYGQQGQGRGRRPRQARRHCLAAAFGRYGNDDHPDLVLELPLDQRCRVRRRARARAGAARQGFEDRARGDPGCAERRDFGHPRRNHAGDGRR